jgi:hypothetical protein
MNNVLSIIKDFDSIETMKDLNKRKLSLTDYKTTGIVLQELAINGKSDFTQKSIFNYFNKFNLKVKEYGNGWQVEL